MRSAGVGDLGDSNAFPIEHFIRLFGVGNGSVAKVPDED
jgi:hypothetical protein